jgi:hypothetical protein
LPAILTNSIEHDGSILNLIRYIEPKYTNALISHATNTIPNVNKNAYPPTIYTQNGQTSYGMHIGSLIYTYWIHLKSMYGRYLGNYRRRKNTYSNKTYPLYPTSIVSTF